MNFRRVDKKDEIKGVNSKDKNMLVRTTIVIQKRKDQHLNLNDIEAGK